MSGKHHQTEVLQNTDDNPLLIDEGDDILLRGDDDLYLMDGGERRSRTVGKESNQTFPWQILVVDDEPALHQSTQLTLTNVQFRNAPLSLLHAYSGEEAKALLKKHSSIGVVLLDMVLETHDAGLKVIQYIRDVLKNRRIQIILCTGSIGEAAEISIIQNYEINDCKLKTELTQQRLIPTITTALRSHCNVVAAEEKTIELEQALHKLRQAELQLVHSEKMSALGNLVASVAHEINNPVSCIMGNVDMLEIYTQQLIDIAALHAQYPPGKGSALEQKLRGIDVNYVRQDLPQLIRAMKDSGDRISAISNGLRTFSRADSDDKQAFNIHDGITSTLLILRHRLKANGQRPGIEVLTEYGEIPDIHCFAGQINQVLMNILANAIDALDEASQYACCNNLELNPHQITIRTSRDKDWVKISISDNGPGISPSVKSKIFDHLFTTKSVGKGTGLGLAIAHQIVVDIHGGILAVHSKERQGTEFVVGLPL